MVWPTGQSWAGIYEAAVSDQGIGAIARARIDSKSQSEARVRDQK